MDFLKISKVFIYFNLRFLFNNIAILLVSTIGFFNAIYQIYSLINQPEYVSWNTVNISKVLFRGKAVIYIYPDSPLVYNLMSLIPGERNIKMLTNTTNNPNTIFLNHNPDVFVYYINSINDVTDLSKLKIGVSDIKKIKLSILIYSNNNIMDGPKSANYINAIRFLGQAFSNKKVFAGTVPYDIFLGGLPDDFDRPLIWPGIYLIFLFGITGCMVINFHKLNITYRYPIATKQNIYLKIISLIVFYNAIGVLTNLAFIPNMIYLDHGNILTKWPMWFVFLVFTVSYNTSLFTASLLTLIKFDLHTVLYGVTLFIAPQILYIFSNGSDLSSSLNFQYLTLILPTYLIGWLVANIETYETFEIWKISFHLFFDFDVQYEFANVVLITNLSFWIVSSIIVYCFNQVKVKFLCEVLRKQMTCHRKTEKYRFKKIRGSHYDHFLKVMDTSDISLSCSSFRSIEDESTNTTDESQVMLNQMTADNKNIVLVPAKDEMPSRHSHNVLKIGYAHCHSGIKTQSNLQMYCIITKSLWYCYGSEIKRNYILKGFSMSARNKSITTIVGQNGSGKSTLIKILSGSIKPVHGNLKIHKVKVKNTKNKDIFSQVAVYSESKLKLQFLTVLEYLNLIFTMDKTKNNEFINKNTIKELAIVLEIDSFFHKKLYFCPHSVVKLVQILSAFIVNASIVLLDEPYKNMDLKYQNNLNSLFIDRKKFQSIVITTSQAESIETCTDKVILMDNGKSIFHSKLLKLRKENRMGFQLICFMEKNAGDYSIIMFVKSLYPEVVFELSLNHKIYFQIPCSLLGKLKMICQDLSTNSTRCGIATAKLSRMDLQTYFNLILHDIHKKIFTFEDHVTGCMKLEAMEKNYTHKYSFIQVYFKQFLLLMRNRYVLLYRFNSMTTLSYLLPLLIVSLFMILGFVFHPKIVVFDSFPKLIDEITFGISKNISSNYNVYDLINSLSNKSLIVNIKVNQSFSKFTELLFNHAKYNSIPYRNSTKVAVYFTKNQEAKLKIVVMSNFENILSKVVEKIQNYFLDYVDIEITNIDLMNFEINRKIHAEKNFILRLMYIAIILFVNNLFNQKHYFHLKKRNKFLKLVSVHYTLCFLPIYLLDIIQVLIFNSFIILIIYMVNDFKFTSPDNNSKYLLLVLTMYGLADVTYKTLIGQITNFGPTTIFCFVLFDLIASFLSTGELLKHYLIFLKAKGYPLTAHCITEKLQWLVLLVILIPSESLSNGLVSYIENPNFYLATDCGNQLIYRRISGSFNSYSIGFVIIILLGQWIVYFILLLIVNYPSYNQRSNKGIFSKLKGLMTVTTCKRKEAHGKLLEGILVSFCDMQYVNKHGVLKFHNFNWEIIRGEIYVILGQNNSGKSLLTKLIAGYKVPTSGKIRFNKKYDNYNYHISFCSQTPILFNELTVKEMFLFWAKMRCVSKKRLFDNIHLIMNELDLLKYSEIIIEHLSQSTIKLVCLGISIIGFPSLIVLDNPLADLDSTSQENVISLVKLANFHRCTIVMTAQEINDLYEITDRVLILQNYQILYQGQLSEFPDTISTGYNVTIICENEITEEIIFQTRIRDKLLWKYQDVQLLQSYSKTVIYFIPFKKKINKDLTLLVIFMETILAVEPNIIQYLIKFSVNM